MSQFVVLIHDHPTLHWDLMLEKEALLRTWRLSRPPCESGQIAAMLLAAHRLAYLDYEGPVGGNRGVVRRFDRGSYLLIEEHDDRVIIELEGAVLRGRVVLERSNRPDRWTFSYFPIAESL